VITILFEIDFESFKVVQKNAKQVFVKETPKELGSYFEFYAPQESGCYLYTTYETDSAEASIIFAQSYLDGEGIVRVQNVRKDINIRID